MKTVQATDTAVSIWISREAAPTREQMLSLVRQALEERGLAPWAETEAECFAAGEDTLVIARPVHGRQGFFFADLEALLGGALACADVPSSLYVTEDGYLLAVAADGAAPALYEYGQARPVNAGWEAHAAEQGACLIREDAVACLRRFFSRGGSGL